MLTNLKADTDDATLNCLIFGAVASGQQRPKFTIFAKIFLFIISSVFARIIQKSDKQPVHYRIVVTAPVLRVGILVSTQTDVSDVYFIVVVRIFAVPMCTTLFLLLLFCFVLCTDSLVHSQGKEFSQLCVMETKLKTYTQCHTHTHHHIICSLMFLLLKPPAQTSSSPKTIYFIQMKIHWL